MQKSFVIISASDLLNMPPLPDNVIKAQIAKERAKYQKMLRDLCPSKEMRDEAKRLSKRQDSCDMCVYDKGDGFLCCYPHSDWYMEDLNIDPCYEGVLRYLVKEAEKENGVISEMLDCLQVSFDIAYDNLQIVRGLCFLILNEAGKKKEKIPPYTLKMVRELNAMLNELLPPLNDNDEGEALKNERKENPQRKTGSGKK